ncbi:MAG: biotin/lipoate A/B protein ligase family protein [Treponema sp.]|nr:biotin/lipoate A/B protein ligase family protein [Treponema sp.]
MKARLLVDGEGEPSAHFAIEEAILRALDVGMSPPTLRIRRSVPAVWIGLFQRPEDEVDLARARELCIPVMRRPNPGGAVFQDEGTLCYSLFAPRRDLFVRLGVGEPVELYALFGEAAIRAIARFGVAAALAPTNDATVGGKKVYGSAQLEQYSVFVHSGTFLVSCDLDRMALLLKPPALKYAERGIDGVRGRVANLAPLADSPMTPELLAAALVPEIERLTGYRFEEAGLTEEEGRLAEQLRSAKYGQSEWTFRKEPRSLRRLSRKTPEGLIGIAATIEGGRLSALEAHGDFLLPDTVVLDDLLAGLRGLPTDEAAKRIKASALPRELSETLSALVEELS